MVVVVVVVLPVNQMLSHPHAIEFLHDRAKKRAWDIKMRIGAANLLFAATVVASWPTCSTAKLILDPDSNTHGDPKVGGRLLSRPKDGQRHYGC